MMTALGIASRSIHQRLLYAVNHSFPFSTNGYAVRSHAIATALQREGFSVYAVSRPGAPWDHPGFSDRHFSPAHQIDGVRYLHIRAPSEREGRFEDYLQRSAKVFSELIRVFKPAVVMAASNWRNAMPPAIAARELGVPFFYEVRGYWEISQLARTPEWAGSSDYQQEVEHETAVACAAQRVFTLNRFMRDELVRRGVAAERIELVPNGFPGWAKPAGQSITRAALGMSARFVVGYVGSFNIYEGLEELIEAVALARGRGVDVSLLLVGSGEPSGFGLGQSGACPATAAYRRLAEKLGFSDHLFMPGRVSAAAADAYYALLDLVVIPRRPFAVCELVSPMKPLEAVSHGVRVLLSDVAPLADLAELSSNFSYFRKGDVASLAEQMVALLHAGPAASVGSAALSALTWENNVAPMARAILEISQAQQRRK